MEKPHKSAKFRTPREEKALAVVDNPEVFQLMEARDETQIVAELKGIFAKEYVYAIPFKTRDGKIHQVTGLSYTGVKEARRLYKGVEVAITEPELIDVNGNKYWRCCAIAVDRRTGNKTTAWKMQPLMKKAGEGFMEDPYAYEIVQSKAKRNSIAELLPQPIVRAWIYQYLHGKKEFSPDEVTDSPPVPQPSQQQKPSQSKPAPQAQPEMF